MSQRIPAALPAALAGAALALHAASLCRVHGLLAGAAPPPGAIVAGVLLAAWALGARGTRPPSRSAALVAALVTAAAAFLAPVALGLMSGLPAVLVSAALAGLPAAAAGRALPGRLAPPLLFGAAAGLLLSAFVLLPRLGPTPTMVLAAALLAAAALLLPAGAASADDADRRTREPEPTEALPIEPLTVWVAAAAVLAALTDGARPWPFAAAASGFAVLGAAVGCSLRLSERTRFALAAGAALLLVPFLGSLLGLDASRLVEADARPLVAPLWGGLALLLAAVGHGLGGGLVAGLATPRPEPGRLVLAGGLLAALGLAPGLLPLHPASPALLGFAGLAVAALTPPGRRLLARPGAALVVTAGLAAVLLLPWAFPGAEGPWHRAGRSAAWSFDAGADPPRGLARVDGRTAFRTGPAQRPNEALAGHLAGLLADRRDAALLIGLRSGEALTALEAQGFETVAVRESSPELAAMVSILAGPRERPAVAAAPSAWPERSGGWDAIVLQGDDPSLAELRPQFTPSAYRRAAGLLAPGGVLVQRLRVDRLGPEGLLGLVRLAQQALPETWVATADLARDGAVLLVARAESAGGVALPWNRLVLDAELNPALDEDVAEHLRSVLLFKRDDLLNAFAAGPAELAALEPEVPAFDPWAPGARSLAQAAPEGVAAQLTRALLYARLQVVELRLDVEPSPGTPPWQDRWPLVGLETQLGEGWAVDAGALRMANRFRPVLGDFGLYRDYSRRLRFARPKSGLEIVEMERTVAGPDTVNASARSLLDEHVTRTFEALVHGHRALGLVREPGGREQHVHLTWHCPVQGRLYLADYRLDEARPGLYEEPLEELGRSLRCSHPAAPPRPAR